MNTNTAIADSPIARGPLLEVHRRGGATIVLEDDWEIATLYPSPPDANALIDLSHWPTFEVNGPQTAKMLKDLVGAEPAVRSIQTTSDKFIYRLSDRRAIVFCTSPDKTGMRDAIDVTGGWATLSLIGPDAETILSKITAVDVRRSMLPPETCCQGPLFGVNTLFGRFENRFDLHVCTDSAEFFWEVLMDAGAEFGLKPAGTAYFKEVTS
jgi:4-methylaminobutanoate oxidase (formaldehyde-forming)